MPKSLKLCVLPILAAIPALSHAQMPVHGTIPESNGSMVLTQLNMYNAAEPYARVNVSITIDPWWAPDETGPDATYRYIEYSTPNSQPILLDAGIAPRSLDPNIPDGYGVCGSDLNVRGFYDCLIDVPLSTADMATSNSSVSFRYYSSTPTRPYEAYKTETLSISGTAGTTSSTGSSGSNPTVHTTIPYTPSFDTIITPFFGSVPVYDQQTRLLTYSNLYFPIPVSPNVPQNFTSELLQIITASGEEHYIDIGNDCTVRSGNYYCSGSLSLSAIDASQSTLVLQSKYFANGLSPNGSSIWTGGGQDTRIALTLNRDALCPTETNPMLPRTVTTRGGFTFTFPPGRACPGEFFIDPPVSTGFDYSVTGTQFSEVRMPSLSVINDTDGYTLKYSGPNGNAQSVALAAGQNHVFPAPVSGFQLRDINPALSLDPADQTAFPTGIALVPTTQAVTVTQTPVTVNVPVGIGGPIIGTRPRGIGIRGGLSPIAIPINRAPIAVSGDILDASGQPSFALDGSRSSDPDGDTLTYKWTQISGPILNIVSANSARATVFLQPTTGPGDVAVFELAVSDGKLTSRPDQVIVEIR